MDFALAIVATRIFDSGFALVCAESMKTDSEWAVATVATSIFESRIALATPESRKPVYRKCSRNTGK
jgi:hypothetical protein